MSLLPDLLCTRMVVSVGLPFMNQVDLFKIIWVQKDCM